MINKNNFPQELKKINIDISSLELDKFNTYYLDLVKKNEVMNLTAITEENEVYKKHFYDSIYLSSVIDLKNTLVADIGPGAGFPSIPLAIINKDTQFDLIEPLTKRCNFLLEEKENLKLDNINIINSRCEDLKTKNKYDYITVRAVSKLNILLEISSQILKVGGYLVALKGSTYKEEIKASEKALKALNMKIVKTITYKLDEDEIHSLILITKTKEVDNKYPRAYAKIKKNPL